MQNIGGKLRKLAAKFNPKMMKLNSDERMKDILWAHRAEMSEADLDYLFHQIEETQLQAATPIQNGRTM